MPPQSVKNGLIVKKLPAELADMTNVENQLIAIDIPCLKIRKVPKFQIEKMADRTYLVPFEPNEVMLKVQWYQFNSKEWKQ